MTREEFSIIVKGLKAVYTDVKFIPDKDAFNVWYAMLSDVPYEVMSLATQMYMAKGRFAPTIADLRERVEIITKRDDEQAELSAWGLVSKAIRDSTYHSKERFEELPPLVKEAVGTAENLHNWGLSDISSVETVIQSNFIKAYRNVVARSKQMEGLPQNILQKIETIKSNALQIGVNDAKENE